MDIFDVLITRQSVRAFDATRPVEAEKLELMIRAGMNAPSAMGQHAWRMLSITNAELLSEMADHGKWWKMLKACPLAIVMMTDTDHLDGLPEEYQVISNAAAAENILLAAHAQGLGGVHLGLSRSDEGYDGLCKLLGVPGNWRVTAILAIGYPDRELPLPADRYEPEKWLKEHI